MGQLVIELKQHTPLLHFQHAQYGATLRATEVKPKLDKFIQQREKKETLASCFIEGSTTALNYKMKIQIGNNSNDPRAENESLKRDEYFICSNLSSKGLEITPDMPRILYKSPYFAQEDAKNGIVKKREDSSKYFDNNEWQKIDKKGLVWPNLSITFFSLNQNLLDYISKHIKQFFICTNFGTRSNKGFGSFTVCKMNSKSVNLHHTNIESTLIQNFDFVYRKKSNLFWKESDPFSVITRDYRLIKSGSSVEGYKKSGFFFYAQKNGYTWDKPYLKSKLSENLHGKCLLVKDKRNASRKTDIRYCKFVRPFLGLTDNYLFQLANKDQITRRKGEAEVKVACKDIERFASPLLFKIIENTIYVVGNSDDIKKISGRSFSFSLRNQGSNTSWIEIGKLDTPDDFDLEHFMHYVLMDKYKNELNYTELKNKYGNTAKR